MGNAWPALIISYIILMVKDVIHNKEIVMELLFALKATITKMDYAKDVEISQLIVINMAQLLSVEMDFIWDISSFWIRIKSNVYNAPINVRLVL